jgi:hypothetical protein
MGTENSDAKSAGSVGACGSATDISSEENNTSTNSADREPE